MKKKKEKEAENPFHREYGIISNSVYVLGKIKRYRPGQLWIMGLGMFTGSLMYYLWSFVSKFVIDIVQVQAESPDKDIAPLVRLMIIIAAAELVSMTANTVVNNRIWYGFIFVRMRVITERIEKLLSMNYQTLEQPEMLDMAQKAQEATGGNNNGIEGLMHRVYDFGEMLIVTLVTFTTVAVLDRRLIIVIAVTSFLQFLFFRHTVKKDRKEVWDVLAPTWRKLNYMERTTQDFDYAKDIRLFGMKNWLSGKQHDMLREKQEKIFCSKNLWIKNSFFSNSMTLVTSAAILGTLIENVIRSDMSIGDFTLYLGLAMTFFSSLSNILNGMGDFKKASMEVDNFRSFMELKDEEEEGDLLPVPSGNTFPKGEGYTFEFKNVSYNKGEGYTFEFKNVSYKYKGSEGYALKNLNLTFEAGKRLAVVGLNGAGKTTFIKLLLRLYDVTEGEILLNGTDIRRFRREEYYRLFAPVFQNVEVFAFPLSENVSMSSPEDTDRELAKKCLVRAGMADKLESLEKGVDTQLLKVIYDDGTDLSGGEKQKLALGRALYKNAPVIVLDEPTAALDALAEYNMYKSFDEIIGDKSAVYISHRLSSTRFCDSIAMFKAGEMVEYGTHEELLKKGGAYAQMFEIQAQYYKENKDKEAAANV